MKSEVACMFQQNKTYLESDVEVFQIEENYVLVKLYLERDMLIIYIYI